MALNCSNCLTETAFLAVEAWAEEHVRVEAVTRWKKTFQRGCDIVLHNCRVAWHPSRDGKANRIYAINRLKKSTSLSERFRLGRVSSTGRRGSMKVVVRELWSMKYSCNKEENNHEPFFMDEAKPPNLKDFGKELTDLQQVVGYCFVLVQVELIFYFEMLTNWSVVGASLPIKFWTFGFCVVCRVWRLRFFPLSVFITKPF